MNRSLEHPSCKAPTAHALKVARRLTDERCVQPASSDPRMGRGEEASASRLDVHASAALNRLTRWAAKALRATVAVVALPNGDDDVVVATHTGDDAALASMWLRDFQRDVQSTATPHAIGDARAVAGDTRAEADGIAFLGAPLLDTDGNAIGSFCVMDARMRSWTIQDIELLNELTASAMTELDLLAARAETERERLWSDRQQAVLELIAARAPLPRTLGRLLDAAETHAPGMLATITRLEPVRRGTDRLRVSPATGSRAPSRARSTASRSSPTRASAGGRRFGARRSSSPTSKTPG